jgi:transposase
MATKGQKYKHYPISMKLEAIRLHEEEGWSYRKITGHFGIQDADRVKVWVRKFRKLGEVGLHDRRGNPSRSETEQDRKVRRLEMEVEVLKKWLEILNREGRKSNIR